MNSVFSVFEDSPQNDRTPYSRTVFSFNTDYFSHLKKSSTLGIVHTNISSLNQGELACLLNISKMAVYELPFEKSQDFSFLLTICRGILEKAHMEPERVARLNRDEFQLIRGICNLFDLVMVVNATNELELILSPSE